MSRLAPKLQDWVTAHRAQPESIVAHSDPEVDSPVPLVRVTASTGDNDSANIVVFNEARNAFGLVTCLDSGRLWYLGEYGELDEAVSNM